MPQCNVITVVDVVGLVETYLFKLQFLIEGAARLLDDVRGRPYSASHGGGQLGALAVLSKKSSDESVSGSVGVNDLLSRESLGWELNDFPVVDADNGVSSLGDDHQTTLAPVLLGQH